MLPAALFWLALLTLVGTAGVLVLFLSGARTVPDLGSQTPQTAGPLVSVIFSALNEGPNLDAALSSLLSQSYERLEFIAINDRSTDDTGEVLERIAARDPRIRVVHITELPPRWLGKNHALNAGAAEAQGEFLLFTDADIIFHRDAIAKAMAFAREHRVDHLTLGPTIESPSAMLELVVNFFALGFLLVYRPWLAPDPDREEHMGIGAFNLVRASLYHGFGGHTRIALRPDDDIKLGRMVKLAGGRQVVARGYDVIRVRWYSSVGEMARGLRKNTFAGLNYSLPMAIGGVLMQVLVNIWPFVAAFITEGPTRWMNLATAVILMSMYFAVAWTSGQRWWLMFGYPLAAAIFSWIIVAATWLTVRRGGIEWRGTFYPLKDLKANKI